MQIRFLEYLVALDQERHFARAAQRCNVSQPTLSAGLVALEEQLGTRLIDRDRRFKDLTPEGKAVLPWAQQMVANFHGLTAAARSVDGPLTGVIRIGVIPAAMPAAGFLAKALLAIHPDLNISFRSLTSAAIVRDLATFEIDAGISYLDTEAPHHLTSVALYAERPVFLVSKSYPQTVKNRISFQEALDHPLCLLHGGMQNRRILDALLLQANLVANPIATADSYETLLAMAASNRFATILPDSYVSLVPEWANVIPFSSSFEASPVGLIVSNRAPLSLMGKAALDAAATLVMPVIS